MEALRCRGQYSQTVAEDPGLLAKLLAYGKMFEPGPLSRPRNVFSPDFPIVTKTRVLYAMARLEEETGDLASARQHYREFLDRWENADMPIPEVDDAKARLAALVSQ